jgi:hypothetical protein
MKKFTFLLLVALLPVIVQAQDVYDITFTSGLTKHRVALVLWSNGSGQARVRYYTNNQLNLVEQTIRLENTQYGYRLTGYNARYAGTQRRHPSYRPDNFYFSQDDYGNLICTNIDDIGNTARCSIRLLQGYSSKQAFLSSFNWELD